jgi:glycosyltransferase involved in cell wall biosynthesis
MKILFITDNFPPEYNAPATRTYEHCREWVKQGAEVTVITCFPNFPKGQVFKGYKNKWKETEYIDGIKVIRVWSFIAANTGTFKRTLDFLSFALTSFLSGLFVKCDLIVATSPQFFSAVSGRALGFFKKKRWVMEVRDIWPESIKAVEAVSSGWIIFLLEKVELFLYRSAYRIVVVTDSFRTNLIGRGVEADKIFVIKNGVDLSVFHPAPKDRALMGRLGIPDKYVVGYVGTHGLAHSLDFIVQSIHKLNDEGLHFVFIGDGAEKKNLVRQVEELGLKNVTFVDPVKKSEIPSYLSMIDIALVPLKRSPTFESVIPSKVFESVAMNTPILLGVNGETRSLIESYNSGIYFEPENEADFIQKLLLMREKLFRDSAYFEKGCKMMSFDFDRLNLAKKMLGVLSGHNDLD